MHAQAQRFSMLRALVLYFDLTGYFGLLIAEEVKPASVHARLSLIFGNKSASVSSSAPLVICRNMSTGGGVAGALGP